MQTGNVSKERKENPCSIHSERSFKVFSFCIIFYRGYYKESRDQNATQHNYVYIASNKLIGGKMKLNCVLTEGIYDFGYQIVPGEGSSSINFVY